jgi:peptidoglycan/xylan/chitin deacetylase (PgdA/CDA1 family)
MTADHKYSHLQHQHWGPDSFEGVFGKELPTKFVDNFPSDKRIAICLTFDTQGDVDAAVPGDHPSGTCYWPGGKKINYCDLTQRQYDTRRGTQRILEILRRHDVAATFPVTGLTAEWYPEIVDMIAADGHEVAAHGYRHLTHFVLDEVGEREEIAAATEAIEKALGRKPRGWRTPMYTCSDYTLKLLIEQGYQWNSDLHNDELPYILQQDDGTSIIEIPAGLDDWSLNLLPVPLGVGMGGVPYASPSHITDIVKSTFDQLYFESREEPQLLQFCMHPKISGMPHRAHSVHEFIKYMRSHDGVWFTTMEEIADLCT